MADAVILNFEKMLQSTNRWSNCHQIWDVDRPHNVQSEWKWKSDVFVETNMGDAAILNLEKMLQFANRLIDCHQIWDVDRPHNALSDYLSKRDVSFITSMISVLPTSLCVRVSIPIHRFALGSVLFCNSQLYLSYPAGRFRVRVRSSQHRLALGLVPPSTALR